MSKANTWEVDSNGPLTMGDLATMQIIFDKIKAICNDATRNQNAMANLRRMHLEYVFEDMIDHLMDGYEDISGKN